MSEEKIIPKKYMRNVLRNMVIQALRVECDNGLSWAAMIVRTLMLISISPDEFTEDAAVNAARLIWEILNDGEVHRSDG